MPFPLAHPAAVLPLRRFCPRYLSFSALLISSIVPDLAYVIDDLNRFSKTVYWLFGPAAQNWVYVREDWEWSTFSHTILGGALFCLPLGALLLFIFFRIRAPLAAKLPQPHRSALLPLCGPRRESVAVCIASLVIGITLHLIWDSFTHDNGWFLQESGYLRGVAFTVGGHTVHRLLLLWLVSSVGGILALVAAYMILLRQQKLPLWNFCRSEGRFYTFWLIVLSLPLLAAVPITVHFVHTESSWDHASFIVHVFSEYYLIILGLLLIGIGSHLRPKN